MRFRDVVTAILLLGLPAAAGGTTEPARPDWRTPAEVAEFRSTPSYDETLDFIRRLAARMPELSLQFFGRSAEGRALPLVVVSSDRAFTPDAAAATGKPIVLIQNGIHAGEIDGKDASLMILRDFALGRRALPDKLILLFVPIYNVDGHERVSPYHRPNQDGPRDGMGFRTTTDGHDLNRDHIKLSTPEARAAIGLFNAWRPHLHVDNHVTDGVEHDWVLTYSWAEAPQAPPSIDAWLRAHMPGVLEATRAAGYAVGPYAALVDGTDPTRGIDSRVGEPRYATGYYPLRNRASILVENHASEPFERRVRANQAFMLALFDAVAAAPAALVASVTQAERWTVALGTPSEERPSSVTLRYVTADSGETVRLPIRDWYVERSRVTGKPLLRYRSDEIREIVVPWLHRPSPAETVARPHGYLVQPGWPVIERRLHGHGLEVRRLDEGVELEVETLFLSAPKPTARNRPTYQGLTVMDVAVERRVETVRFPPGTLWIPAAQPDFEVAVQLLEPEAPDSLVRWGLLSRTMEQKEYIGGRNLEKLAAAMLDDAETAAAWKEALKDEAFAADARARYTWWYRRTPYWDATVGRLPVMRLMTAAALQTVPWRGPAVE